MTATIGTVNEVRTLDRSTIAVTFTAVSGHTVHTVHLEKENADRVHIGKSYVFTDHYCYELRNGCGVLGWGEPHGN